MSIKVVFEFETTADAINFLAAQEAGAVAGGDKPKRGRPPAKVTPAPESQPAGVAGTAAAPAGAAPTTAAASTAASPAATVPAKDVVDALCALADLGGEYHEKAKAILAKYGATSFGKQPNNPASRELDPKHYAAALADFKAAMPGPTPAASLI
jgi:hypothetical protein